MGYPTTGGIIHQINDFTWTCTCTCTASVTWPHFFPPLHRRIRYFHFLVFGHGFAWVYLWNCANSDRQSRTLLVYSLSAWTQPASKRVRLLQLFDSVTLSETNSLPGGSRNINVFLSNYVLLGLPERRRCRGGTPEVSGLQAANWKLAAASESPVRGSPTSMPRMGVGDSEPTPQRQKLPNTMGTWAIP